MMESRPIKVATINFWPGFRLAGSFLGHLLRQAFGAFEHVPDEAAADLVLTSVFLGTRPRFPERTISIVWENLRPNFDLAHYAVSSDFDDYGGRNGRCPYWYTQLAWDGFDRPAERPGANNHGFEPLVPIAELTTPRNATDQALREKFCCFIAGNPEGHRILAAAALDAISRVDRFGNVVGVPLRRSKFEMLPRYRFNLCFENSIFPGYYTEKPLHAWVAGCVPLYFADPHLNRDFNPKALVNRLDFATLDEFVSHVRRLEQSAEARAEIVAAPLLHEPPTLAPVIAFLRDVLARIRQSSRPTVAVAPPAAAMPAQGTPSTPRISRNAPCPCGSGLKYKRCHGHND